MAIKQKSELVKAAIRTTTRAFNLRIAKEVEDQARQHAEAEPSTGPEVKVTEGSDFKGKP